MIRKIRDIAITVLLSAIILFALGFSAWYEWRKFSFFVFEGN